MSQEDRDRDPTAWGLLWATLSFLAVYTTIHGFLNLTGNGAYQIQWPGEEFFYEMSGPFTIGVSTTLLILSFGMFIHNGLEDVSLAYPTAFMKCFLVFISAFILIQIAGHAEIYINECEIRYENDKQIKALEQMYYSAIGKSECEPNGYLKFISKLTYIFLPSSILIIDGYQNRIYNKIKDQAVRSKKEYDNTSFSILIGIISIYIVTTKFVFLNDAEGYKSIVKYTLLAELAMLIVVYGKYFGIRSVLRSKIVRAGAGQKSQGASNVD